MSSKDPGSPSSSFGKSILKLVRHGSSKSKVANHESSSEDLELESFQTLVLNHFNDLLTGHDTDEFLVSLEWISKLLNAFMSFQIQFNAIVMNNKERFLKPPLDKHISDFLNRNVKALDICNAVRDAIDVIRQLLKPLEIVVNALDPQQSIPPQVYRAQRALINFSKMLNEKDTCFTSGILPQSWSAFKQLQLMTNNLVPPRENEIAATNGLVLSIFTMSFVLVFVFWIIVAALPHQHLDGSQVHFPVTRKFSWGTSFISLHERIMKEAKNRASNTQNGILKEIIQMERCALRITDLLNTEQEEEITQDVLDLKLVCDALNSGLSPLEQQVRDVFRKLSIFQVEGQDLLSSSSR